MEHSKNPSSRKMIHLCKGRNSQHLQQKPLEFYLNQKTSSNAEISKNSYPKNIAKIYEKIQLQPCPHFITLFEQKQARFTSSTLLKPQNPQHRAAQKPQNRANRGSKQQRKSRQTQEKSNSSEKTHMHTLQASSHNLNPTPRNPIETLAIDRLHWNAPSLKKWFRRVQKFGCCWATSGCERWRKWGGGGGDEGLTRRSGEGWDTLEERMEDEEEQQE